MQISNLDEEKISLCWTLLQPSSQGSLSPIPFHGTRLSRLMEIRIAKMFAQGSGNSESSSRNHYQRLKPEYTIEWEYGSQQNVESRIHIMGRFIGLNISIYISQISIYTLSDLGVLSNLICSLSQAIQHNYSFKIFLQFWLARSTCIIHHNQLLMTNLEEFCV